MAELYSIQSRRKLEKAAAACSTIKEDEMQQRRLDRAKREALHDIRWELAKGFSLFGKTELELQVSLMLADLERRK
jgi:hypothetical protein